MTKQSCGKVLSLREKTAKDKILLFSKCQLSFTLLYNSIQILHKLKSILCLTDYGTELYNGNIA